MELATNSFNKGILMDTHPMVLGNDSLTDCLNGTLITMDGNEVILQNDMGNRKVDNAYLPAGYQPVGIKEHGGIIYVASYNPITNKSLIGSFPSPERKISSNDKSDLEEINLKSLLEEVDSEGFLIKDSILIPVSGDSILHPGDKFILYGDLSKYETDITNYNNTNGIKVISPKNKKYTLQLGILNSQNQFVDITKNLLRWKNNKEKDSEIIYYNSSVLDLYKFNDGYFIPNKVTITELNQTIDDKILLEERLALPTNTYLNKLNGPLYLKASLNHISNFSYSISANILDSKLKIFLNAIVEYNCPDTDTTTNPDTDTDTNSDTDTTIENLDTDTENLDTENPDTDTDTDTTIENPDPTNDINYISYYEVFPTYDFFDFFSNPLVHDGIILDLISSEKSKSIYNPNTNLYKCNINNIYTLKENNSDYELSSDELDLLIEKGIKYDIKAKVPYLIKTNSDSTKTYTYLKKFSYNGEINVSNYGVSGINKWKFKYNTDNSLIIDFAIGDENGINDLKFLFTNVTNDSDSTTFPNDSDSTTTNPIGNNATSIEGTINLSNLTPDALYKVTWSYTKSDGESVVTRDDRWVIVNGMFNDCYDSINDFGIKSDEILNKAKFSVSLAVSTTNTITTKNIKEEKSGRLFSLQHPSISAFLRKEENAINQATITIQQNNNTLPSFLTLDLSKVSVSVPSEVSVPNTNVNIELYESNILRVDTNTIKVQSNLKIPSFLAPTEFELRTCDNVFVPMYHFIYDLINNKTTVYGGCYVICGREEDSGKHKSRFRVFKSTREQISRKFNMSSATSDGYYKGAIVADRGYTDHNQTWDSRDILSDSNIKIRNKMFDELAEITEFTIPSDQVFLWGYNDNNNNLDCKSYITNDPLMLNYMSKSNEIYGEHNEFCRFFWKSNQITTNNNTKWALMPEPIYKYSGNFANYFWDHYLPDKYKFSKFAYYKKIDLYVPDISNSIYTNYKDIPIIGQIYGVKLNNNYNKSLFSSWIPDFTPIISEGNNVELCKVSSDLGIRDTVEKLQESTNLSLLCVDLFKDIINLNLNSVDYIYDYDDHILSDSIFSLYTDNNTTLRVPLYNLPDNESSWLKYCPSYNKNKKSKFDVCWAKSPVVGLKKIIQAGFEYTYTYAVKI